MAELTKPLLHLKNATVAANRSAADPLYATCKHSHTECMKTLMNNGDILFTNTEDESADSAVPFFAVRAR